MYVEELKKQIFKERMNVHCQRNLKRKKRNNFFIFILLGLIAFVILGNNIYQKKRDKYAYIIVLNSKSIQLLVDNKAVIARQDGSYGILLGKHRLEIINTSSYFSNIIEVSLEKEDKYETVENPLVKKQVSFEVYTKNNLEAEVFVNGDFVGETPYFGKIYYEGLNKKYNIEVKKEGYTNSINSVVEYKTLMNKEKNSIRVVLRKKEGIDKEIKKF